MVTECPTCKLSMESHSTTELIECCMKQVGDGLPQDSNDDVGMCPNCKHDIKKHSNKELADCTLAFLKSDLKD